MTTKKCTKLPVKLTSRAIVFCSLSLLFCGVLVAVAVAVAVAVLVGNLSDEDGNGNGNENVRFTFWYIYLPSSAKQQREMTKFYVF